MKSPKLRNLLARRARDIAVSQHNVVNLRENLRAELARLAFQHTRSLKDLLEFNPSPEFFLTSAASHFLLNPVLTLAAVESESDVRQTIEFALSAIDSSDPLRAHYLMVRSWAEGQSIRDIRRA